MKVFISFISLLIFFWSMNVEALKSKKDRIEEPTTIVLEKDGEKDFDGLWVNESAEQRKMITKCKIATKKNSFVVQMWGACTPQDCEWGENVANEVKKGTDKFELLWDNEFAESAITYEIIDEKLKMTHIRRYKDNSGRQDITVIEYFIKQ